MEGTLTKEEILQAAHAIQERQTDFTAKDVWYELRRIKKVGKYMSRSSDMHMIAAVLLKSGAHTTTDSVANKRYCFEGSYD